MEKRKYIKPVLETEQFVPQEYCAACVKIDSAGAQSGAVYEDLDNNNQKDFNEGFLGLNDYFIGQSTFHVEGRVIGTPKKANNFDIEEYNADNGTISNGTTVDWHGYWYTIEVNGRQNHIFCQNEFVTNTNMS